MVATSLSADLSAMLAAGCIRHGVPGAQLGLLRDGRHHVFCAGVRRMGESPPVERSTPFHAGSIAKSLATTLVLDAAARGELDLDVPASAQGVAGWDESPRRVMSHTSGRPELLPDSDETVAGFVARVAPMPLVHPPGRFSYSNAVWSVVEALLEAATGRDFEAVAAARLLDPLGLPARFGAPSDGATAHQVAGPGAAPQPVPPMGARAASAAGSRWWVTAGELLALAELHLDDGVGVVAPGVAEQQRRQHAVIPQRTVADGWALGWAIWERGAYRAVGWNGYTSGHRAMLRIYPEAKAALVLLTNGAGPLFGGAGGTALFDELLPTCTQALGVPAVEPPAGAGSPGPPVADLAGPYAFATVVTVDADHLTLTAPPLGVGVPLRFARRSESSFVTDPVLAGGMPIAFDGGLLYLGPFALPRTG